MGQGASKTCKVDSPKFKTTIWKLTTINKTIEKLAGVISNKDLSGNFTLPYIPNELVVDLVSFLLSGDTIKDNGSSRYNAYIGFFKQMSVEQRREKGQERLKELIMIRSNLATQLANMCPE